MTRRTAAALGPVAVAVAALVLAVAAFAVPQGAVPKASQGGEGLSAAALALFESSRSSAA